MSREIPLSRGLVALVDDSDYEWLTQWKWRASGRRFPYAVCAPPPSTGLPGVTRMHRLICGAEPGDVVDHINHNTLDNHRANLRIGTQWQNTCNQSLRASNTSGFKGVTRAGKDGRWTAKICVQRRTINLGVYESAVEAACAYDRAAQECFGDFACLNFPDASPAASAVRISLAKGADHHRAKLTDEQILEARAIYRPHSREVGSVALARRYGVDSSTLRRAISGKSWAHISDLGEPL